MKNPFARFFQPTPVAKLTDAQAEDRLEQRRKKNAMRISQTFMAYLEELASSPLTGVGKPTKFPIQLYEPPKGVAPARHVLAMDAELSVVYSGTNLASFFSGFPGFPGFPYLSELTQMTEYRDMSERVAAEMTRKWIKFKSKGDDDKVEAIAIIEAAMKRHDIRGLFREAATKDGWFGRMNLFINLGDTEGDELAKPLMINPYKIKRGSLKGFKLVEPITTYPAAYNASLPLEADYYVPSAWFVYGQRVHATRLLEFCSRPLPDLLKPVYNFSGISLSQLAQPYVDYWLSTRNSVGNLLRNFSTSVLATDMSSVLQGGDGSPVFNRAKVFTALRDNQGIFLIDKEQEDFKKVETSLAGLDKLQAQAQEHMAAVAKTPLVILLGITPAGLNNSQDSEIRIFYDYVADQQEILFRPNLDIVIKVIMLSELGYIDEDIEYDFEPLYAMTEKELALIRKSDGEAGVAYITAGVIDAEEERTRVANDPQSGYSNLDLNKVITPPMQQGQWGGAPADGSGLAGEGNEMSLDPNVNQELTQGVNDAMDLAFAADAAFTGNQHVELGGESTHPYTVAARASSAASKATKDAQRSGTKRNHEKAFKAHGRALAAHQRALGSASPLAQQVHQTFIDAHAAAQAAHELGKVGA